MTSSYKTEKKMLRKSYKKRTKNVPVVSFVNSWYLAIQNRDLAFLTTWDEKQLYVTFGMIWMHIRELFLFTHL